jgi:glycosyltransferase involved in cell wall biosynthesis
MAAPDPADPHDERDSPRIAIITAGAADMYCGSCLHDNALAREVHHMGVDVQLIPTYTPIRTDETNVSLRRVFFGGINVYLDQKVPLYHRLPTALVGWLDHPAMLRWATARGIETDASQLGPMCVSMLRGPRGRQRREVVKLCRDLEREFRPQLVSFSNMLIAGSAPLLKQRLRIPLVVTLQGDDIFLDCLPAKDRARAIAEIANIDTQIDAYLVHSQFYADKMSRYLNLERSKMHVVPLGVSADDLQTINRTPPGNDLPTIGYLARLAPEKGLHLVCQAVESLRQREPTGGVRLRVAGWLPPEHRDYADQALRGLRATDLTGAVVQYDGVIDRNQKKKFLSEIDLLCVPSPYQEPKGLYVLEALAAGVPVVSPDHGAFPELRADTGGLALFRAGDLEHLTDVLDGLLMDAGRRRALGQQGRSAVIERRSAKHAAEAVMAVYRELIGA